MQVREACANQAVFIETGCSLPSSVLDADGHLWSKCELDSELGLSWKRPYKSRPNGPEAQAGPTCGPTARMVRLVGVPENLWIGVKVRTHLSETY